MYDSEAVDNAGGGGGGGGGGGSGRFEDGVQWGRRGGVQWRRQRLTVTAVGATDRRWRGDDGN